MKYLKLFEQFTSDIFDKVRNDYFNSPIVDFNKEQRNGYEIGDSHIIFGCRMPDGPDIEYLFHEMGHFVTIKDYNRLLKPYYGLSYPTIEVLGNEYPNASNWTDIKNEIRATCFQYSLMKHYNQPDTIDTWLKTFEQLDGFIFVPIKDATYDDEQGWIDSNGIKLSHDIILKGRRETILEFFDVESKKERYTIENFNKEWFNRVLFLERNFI